VKEGDAGRVMHVDVDRHQTLDVTVLVRLLVLMFGPSISRRLLLLARPAPGFSMLDRGDAVEKWRGLQDD